MLNFPLNRAHICSILTSVKWTFSGAARLIRSRRTTFRRENYTHPLQLIAGGDATLRLYYAGMISRALRLRLHICRCHEWARTHAYIHTSITERRRVFFCISFSLRARNDSLGTLGSPRIYSIRSRGLWFTTPGTIYRGCARRDDFHASLSIYKRRCMPACLHCCRGIARYLEKLILLRDAGSWLLRSVVEYSGLIGGGHYCIERGSNRVEWIIGRTTTSLVFNEPRNREHNPAAHQLILLVSRFIRELGNERDFISDAKLDIVFIHWEKKIFTLKIYFFNYKILMLFVPSIYFLIISNIP